MGTRQYLFTLLRLLFIIGVTLLVYKSFQMDYFVTAAGLLLICSFAIWELLMYIRHPLKTVEKHLESMLHGDFSNYIPLDKQQKQPLLQKIAQLFDLQQRSNLQNSSEHLIFEDIIESLGIGMLILRTYGNGPIEIFQMNKAFSEFLKIPKYHHWPLLVKKMAPLWTYIEDWTTKRHVISLTINEESESFFLKTSITHTQGYKYMIVSLETIQQLIEKKEKEAWYKLMNVMSHEIINTITPISSLSENLESVLRESPNDPDTLEELEQGLKIINKRSTHLRSFVDTYRQLAELPMPQKSLFNLNDLIRNTLTLFEPQFKALGIQVHFTSTHSEVRIAADKQQIEQVFINLYSNAVYALKGAKTRVLQIHLEVLDHRTLVHITDTGIGISEAIKANIFVPYFTTRKDGSGIGLTLSKSIMEAHQGKIQFQSKTQKTTFTLTFI